jgi:hypothetical protein
VVCLRSLSKRNLLRRNKKSEDPDLEVVPRELAERCYHSKTIACSYRIRRAMTMNILPNISLKNEMEMYREIICAVDIHRKAMESVFVPRYECNI